MIKAIIFDCFGVLAEDGWLPFKRKYIGDNEDLAEQVGDLGKQNEYGMISNDEYFKQAAELIGCPESELRDAVGRKVPNLELIEYIKNNLKQKYKIGLLSNANYDVVSELFSPEQASLFDATVMSYESRLVKPDPRMFELMAERLDVELNECVFIDDVERYCEVAERLGMTTVMYESTDELIKKLKPLLVRV